MSDTTEKLRRELGAARRTIAELQTRLTTLELDENRSALLFMLEDLEAGRKKIEHAHQEWMTVLDVVDDPIFLHDKKFRILRCNKAYQRCAGISFEQIIGQPYYEIFPKTGAPLACCLRVMEKTEDAAGEEEVTVGDAIYRLRAFSVHDEHGGYLHSAHVLEDITASRRTEAELHDSEEKFRKITESAQDAIIMMGADQCISFWNIAAERIFGYTAAEAMGRELHAIIAPEPAHAQFTQAYPHFQASGEGPIIGKVVEVTALRKGGEEFPVELSISATQLNGQWHAISTVRDITVRKRAAEALSDINERNKATLAAIPDAMFRIGHDGVFLDYKPSEQVDIYAPPDVFLGKRLDEVLLPDVAKTAMDHIERCVETRIVQTFEYQLPIKGEMRDYEARLALCGKDEVVAIVRDITERKQAETAIQHANRALATLSKVNSTLIRATNEDELLQAICQAIVEQRGYRMAWVGYVQHDAAKSIKIMASAGHDEGYLDALQLTWAETEHGMGPSGHAIRSGTTQLCQDIANDPHYSPWRDAARQRGYASSIALPLTRRSGKVFGILNVYAEEVNAFISPAETDLLEEMAGDMAFGVRSLHIRRQRDFALEQNQQHLERLQASLEDTIRAIATIVEMRDPYTAGHQARVADLAAAIAGQMGLPDEQVHGIHLAGLVHDLGKIQIPAEILSKPGKITDIEYSLIKTHPQAGYDILKDIDFPWPIAQMVLQHHEKLDGSGYPQGLQGNEILLEARIMAVADVVEAMSSHRPYRPGLGLDAALAEIGKGRGSHYDPDVVDACMKLFTRKGYAL